MPKKAKYKSPQVRQSQRASQKFPSFTPPSIEECQALFTARKTEAAVLELGCTGGGRQGENREKEKSETDPLLRPDFTTLYDQNNYLPKSQRPCLQVQKPGMKRQQPSHTEFLQPDERREITPGPKHPLQGFSTDTFPLLHTLGPSLGVQAPQALEPAQNPK